MRDARPVAWCGTVVLALILSLGALAATTEPAKPKPVNYTIGQKVEVKSGLSWREAVVRNKGNGWILIHYTPGSFHEWVPPWRVRTVGSTEDNLPFVMPGDTLFRPQPPPTAKPPPPPEPDAPRASAKASPATHAANSSTRSPRSQAPTTVPALPLKEIDVTGVKELKLSGGDAGGWAIAPDPSEQPRTLSAQPIALSAGSLGFFVRPERLLFATPATPTAYVMQLDHDPGRGGGSYLERLDLAAGKSLATLAIPHPLEARDISRDGKLLLAVSADRSGDDYQQRVDIWDISDSKPRPIVSFRPVSEAEQRMSHDRTVTWARFIAADQLLIRTAEKLSCWDFANARAVWWRKTDDTPVALSPGAKYLALGAGKDVLFLDPQSGKGLARVATDRPVRGTLAFRRDGRLLAHAGGDILHIWDLSTGKPLLSSTVDAGGSRLDWIGDGYLLLGGSMLFDLNKQITVWEYTGLEISGTFAGRFWYVARDAARSRRGWSLASVALPDPQTLAEIAKLGDDLYAIKPGTPVTVDVGGLPGEFQEKARAAMTKNLTAAGLIVAENQPTRVIARIEPGKTTEMTYRSFGARAIDEGTKLSVTSQVSKLQILGPDGQTIWERQAGTSPPIGLSLKEGQTIDQAVAEFMKPSGWLFENTHFPSRIAKAKNGFGTSALTAEGVKDVKRRAEGE